MPMRIGIRPVIMVAREGEHTWKPEYHCVNLIPLFARPSRFVVVVVGALAALACYLPAFLVAPLTLGALARGYRRVFPQAEEAASAVFE